MKTKFLLALAISTVAYSQSSFAGSITDTYTTGDTLTADKLNNIKSEVNDNDTRIAANIATFDTVFSGDGSAGNLTLAGGETVNWISNPPENPYFGNIILNAGSTLIVPSGTTIYCNGSFVNAGTLRVQPATAIGSSIRSIAYTGDSPTNAFPAYAHPGDTPAPASMGETNDISIQPGAINLMGGSGGLAIQKAVATTAFGKFKFGGGSGAGFNKGTGVGGRAGGLVKIYALVNILNNNGGTIVARGEDGDDAGGDALGGIGGGGGGIVVLAARFGGVQNVGGEIDVSGGNGSSSTTYAGNGGGGGGGIIIMASPVAPVLGTETVAGGSGGTGAAALTTNTQIAGGGGGGSGGKGGTGGYIQSNLTPLSAGNGDPGYVISLTLDPIALAR